MQVDLNKVVEIIVKNQYQKVALQFQNTFLGFCHEITQSVRLLLQKQTSQCQVYIIAHTNENGLSIDQVTAQHVDADCVIHFGASSTTKATLLPSFNVFNKATIDIEKTCSDLIKVLKAKDDVSSRIIVIFLEQQYLYAGDKVYRQIQEQLNSVVIVGADNQEMQVAQEQLFGPYAVQATLAEFDHVLMLWIGSDESEVGVQVMSQQSGANWLRYNPQTGEIQDGIETRLSALQKRRYYLCEKAKQVEIFGILVSSMGISGIKEAQQKLYKMIRGQGKGCYTIVMGTPTPTKLANFAEVEMWVQLADVTAHILDSKEYFVPIITPYEALVALEWLPWTGKHVLGFQCVLDFGGDKISSDEITEKEECNSSSSRGQQELWVGKNVSDRLQMISCANEQQKKELIPKTATEFFALKRNFRGLNFDEKKEASDVQKGLSGRAAAYASEPRVS